MQRRSAPIAIPGAKQKSPPVVVYQREKKTSVREKNKNPINHHPCDRITATTGSSPINTWVDDTSVNSCMECGIHFSLFVRRHHCRMCGRVFCYACTPHMEIIPDRMQKLVPKSPPKYSTYMWQAMGTDIGENSKRKKRRRLCKRCHLTIVEQQQSEQYTIIIEMVMRQWFQLNDEVMKRLACVSRRWNSVASLFRVKFHNLVHTRLITDSHFRVYEYLLQANAELIFASYPQALPCLMQVIHQKATPQLTLSKVVAANMSLESSLQFMGTYPKSKHTGEKKSDSISKRNNLTKNSKSNSAPLLSDGAIRMRLNGIIHKTAENVILGLREAQALSMLTRIAFLGNDNTLRLFILSQSPKIVFKIYWILRVYRPEMAACALNTDAGDDIRASLTVIHMLEELVSTSDEQERSAIANEWRTKKAAINKHIRFPSLYDKYVVDVLWRDIKLVHSHSAPSVVPFILEDIHNNTDKNHHSERQKVSNKQNKTQNKKIPTTSHSAVRVDILYKKESVINDVVMMECLSLIHSTLRQQHRTFQWTLNIVWYSVVPLSRDSGIVSMVPRSRTLHGITLTGLSLQNYLLEHNIGETVNNLRLAFVRSCAVCCVQSMLFGLGDRHLDNILLTEDGVLFHVDYGYIFGREPSGQKIVRRGNCMKLTPSIVDIMGGEQSKYFAIFREQTTLICNILRSKVNLFAVICAPLVSCGAVEKEAFNRHFYTTFRPGQGEKETTIQIKNIIEYNTHHRALDAIMDKIHNACALLF